MKHRKKVICLGLALILLAGSAACGGDSPRGTPDAANPIPSAPANVSDIPETNAPEPTPAPTPTPEPTKSPLFEPSEDLKVTVAFVYDGDTYIVVENTGDQAILNYTVAYINFDKNGFVATRDSDGYEAGRASTANIMPGEKYIAGWYGADGVYAVATVTGIDYADGTTWEAPSMQVDYWVKETSKNFSVENQSAMIATLKETGVQAEQNEYASLTDISIKHGNQFSSEHDFHFSIKNTSEQGITTLNVYVLEFDKNGFPVSVSPYDTYCANGHQTGGKVNLASGKSGSYSDDLFLSSTTTQIKVVISYIEFQDGSEWTNPYLYEWLIGNSKSY